MELIDATNYELFLLRYAEGELTDEQRHEVEQWLAAHPSEAEELQLYIESPRLEARTDVHYGGSIPHSEPLHRPTAWRWVAAAAVLIAVATPLLLPRGGDVPVQMASISPSEIPTLVVDSIPTGGNTAEPTAMKHAPLSVEPSVLAQSEMLMAENFELPTVEMDDAIDEMIIPEEAEESIPQLIYVDNLLTEDTTSHFEQQLLALNHQAREQLQSTYVGRRIARQLPSDEQVSSELRATLRRVPRGVRMTYSLIETLSKTIQ